jgi:hypothetical protein
MLRSKLLSKHNTSSATLKAVPVTHLLIATFGHLRLNYSEDKGFRTERQQRRAEIYNSLNLLPMQPRQLEAFVFSQGSLFRVLSRSSSAARAS